MSAFYDEVPTFTTLLMQCGYRSKVCTNHRATKLDGTPHKLCEFHRRKANLNQQRLHKRQREKRARNQQSQLYTYETAETPTKRARQSLEIVDPIAHSTTDGYYPNYTPLVDASSFPMIGSADMDILELLLLDLQPQNLPPLLSSASFDDKSTIAV
ncbi:Hypothetical protein PHPALM_15662 [Phytophthora palmivora]|uniref:Uncharacterized protein n=1 Tax=Phytophthora palmivora TaxID=4796 RepID=A0A2P4XRM7_9STRA|nr:Hypothetical protein PHPALM_15662 [Phytophthora palmivora]